MEIFASDKNGIIPVGGRDGTWDGYRAGARRAEHRYKPATLKSTDLEYRPPQYLRHIIERSIPRDDGFAEFKTFHDTLYQPAGARFLMDAPLPQFAAGPAVDLDRVVSQCGEIIVGKEHTVKLALACLMAGGHLLIEDLPGVGKTTLAQTLARVMGLPFSRIQFTSDLLPADVIGVSVYEAERSGFRFHPGPIFSSVVLADEINRATPKAQSALLEAMEEKQISADGETYPLPQPFFVIATQNPQHQIGTFPLPESQLDRFLMRIDLGYPDARSERLLLAGQDRRELLQGLTAVADADSLVRLQARVRQVHTGDALLDYVQALLQATRSSARFRPGLSPRAGIALVQAARAWALLSGRDLVLPEDVQAVAPGVFDHRLQGDEEVAGDSRRVLVQQLLDTVAVP